MPHAHGGFSGNSDRLMKHTNSWACFLCAGPAYGRRLFHSMRAGQGRRPFPYSIAHGRLALLLAPFIVHRSHRSFEGEIGVDCAGGL